MLLYWMYRNSSMMLLKNMFKVKKTIDLSARKFIKQTFA